MYLKSILTMVAALLIAAGNATADIKLSGLISEVDGGLIFTPCFCVKGDDCPCMKGAATDSTYYFIDSHYVKDMQIDKNAPVPGTYNVVLADNAKLVANLKVPFDAAHLANAQNKALNADLQKIPEEVNVSVGFSSSRLFPGFHRYPGQCIADLTQCRCMLDGAITDCSFVYSCLDAGFCYVAKAIE
jgi:hypothetical protein